MRSSCVVADDPDLDQVRIIAAEDDSMVTCGPRKAECDRIVTAAADRGVAATSVRPTVAYGPQTIQTDDGTVAADAASWADDVPATWADDAPDIQTHHDYRFGRIDRYDAGVTS